MAICSNCNNGSTAASFTSGLGSFPSSQFGLSFSYPSTCPGGCLYFTTSGYRCSNSSVGTGRGCSSNCGCGCGCNNNRIMPF